MCSPSLTLDSGRGSSSAPSSPAKEMSPVQSGGVATAAGGIAGGASSGLGAVSNSSHASPVFARKLSRPIEYLLGQQTDDGQSEPGFVPDPPASGSSSGNFASYCSNGDPLLSFVTTGSSGGGLTINQRLNAGSNNERNNNSSGFSSGIGDCEILQIREDHENTNVRKDSLEEDEQHRNPVDRDVTVINNVDSVAAGSDGVVGIGKARPRFLVGGDIMQPDLDVPNEVFGPLSHAEILSRNLTTAAAANNINSNNNNNVNSTVYNSSAGSGRQGNKPGKKIYMKNHILSNANLQHFFTLPVFDTIYMAECLGAQRTQTRKTYSNYFAM